MDRADRSQEVPMAVCEGDTGQNEKDRHTDEENCVAHAFVFQCLCFGCFFGAGFIPSIASISPAVNAGTLNEVDELPGGEVVFGGVVSPIR